VAPTRIVQISAGAGRPSRTTALVSAAAREIAKLAGASIEAIELGANAPHLFSGLARAEVDAEAERLLRTIETSDLLVVGSPVYRGSYTGLFKHLFDLVDSQALRRRPVVIAATGGSHEHALVLEHQFRPLFGFFGAVTIPTGLYGSPGDFKDGEVVGPLAERVTRVAEEALSFLNRDQAPARPAAKVA